MRVLRPIYYVKQHFNELESAILKRFVSKKYKATIDVVAYSMPPLCDLPDIVVRLSPMIQKRYSVIASFKIIAGPKSVLQVSCPISCIVYFRLVGAQKLPAL